MKIRFGLVVFFSQEERQATEKQIVNQVLRSAEFPPPEFKEGHSGHRIGRRKLLDALTRSQKTIVLPAERFLERVDEFRWFGPGDDRFLINAHLLDWIYRNAPSGGHLVLTSRLPPLPGKMQQQDVKLIDVAYSIGRWLTSQSHFTSIHYNGQSYFLKHRAGEIGRIP